MHLKENKQGYCKIACTSAIWKFFRCEEQTDKKQKKRQMNNNEEKQKVPGSFEVKQETEIFKLKPTFKVLSSFPELVEKQ